MPIAAIPPKRLLDRQRIRRATPMAALQAQAGNDGLRERSAMTGGAASVEKIERARRILDALVAISRRQCSL